MDPENAGLLSAFHRYANGVTGSAKYMPGDMKDAPEVVVPPDVMKRAQFLETCPPDVQALYTRIWTELQK